MYRVNVLHNAALARGTLHNLYDIPDLDNSWWVSDMQEDLTIKRKLFGAIGCTSLSMFTR